MGHKELIDKIAALPPEKRAEVEDFVDSVAARGRSAVTLPDLVAQIHKERSRLLDAQGLIGTDGILRDLREHGGR
jgi:hypothetical protein